MARPLAVSPARAHGGCLGRQYRRRTFEDARISEWGNPPAVMGRHRRLLRGVRREVKHLSTCRKGYSVSSGERKRIRPNRVRVIPVGGCVRGVEGARVPVPTDRAGVIKRLARGTGLKAWPQRVPAPYLDACRLPIACPK